MKKIIMFIVYVLLVFQAQSIINPHLLLIEISNSDNSFPLAEDINFNAYIQNDESDVINATNLCSFYREDLHLLEIQFSDFESYEYVENQNLVVNIIDLELNITTTKSFLINNNPAQIFHSSANSEGIILSESLPSDDVNVVVNENPEQPVNVPVEVGIDTDGDNEPDELVNLNIEVTPDVSESNQTTVEVTVNNPTSPAFPNNVPQSGNASMAISINISGNSQPDFWIQIPFSGWGFLPNEVIRKQGESWILLSGEDIQWLPNFANRSSVKIRGEFSNGRDGAEVYVLNRGEGSSTLPVTLSSFTANNFQNNDNSEIKIQWKTESETNLIGYNLFRSNSSFENSQKINNFLVSAEGNSSVGADYSYFDSKDLIENTDYFYWLEAIFDGENSVLYGSVNVKTPQTEDIPEIVFSSHLIGNYPNPFGEKSSSRVSNGTNIFYDLNDSDKQNSSISVYNILGQKLIEFNNLSVGKNQSVFWNGKDINNNQVASGVYFYQFKTADKFQTKKTLFLK